MGLEAEQLRRVELIPSTAIRPKIDKGRSGTRVIHICLLGSGGVALNLSGVDAYDCRGRPTDSSALLIAIYRGTIYLTLHAIHLVAVPSSIA